LFLRKSTWFWQMIGFCPLKVMMSCYVMHLFLHLRDLLSAR
jgi:hypothetical protein